MELNKFPYARSCLAGAIALALLTGCGGGGGGSKGSGGGGSEPVTVSGAAAKGIIKNGVVKIYGVDGNGVRGTTLAEGRTSSTDGTYSLSVSGYSGPVIVEITALEAADEGYPSLMVCDIAGTASCHDDVDDANDIGFGEDYELGSGFALKAVVPAVRSGQSVTTNVTALTDLAASLAENNGVTADAVNLANTQVANLFKLTGDITKLPVVDITDPAALEALSGSTLLETESLKAALLSAALLSAAKADGNSIETATGTVASGFVANNGQLVQNQAGNTATTTLAEILAEAETLISDELSEVEALDQVATNITTEQNTAETAPEGSTTTAEPSEDALSDGFAKARALVQDLRDLATAATFEEIQTGTTEFADNLSLASDMIGTDAGRAMEALSMVASAIVEAAQAEAEGPTYQAENGIVVTVASVEGVATYSFTGDVVVSDDMGDHTLAVELTGSGVFAISEEIEESETNEGWSDVGAVAITVDFDLVGAVTNSVMSLELKEGSKATVTGFNESWNDLENESGWDENESLSIDNIGFTLNVRLEQSESDVIPLVFDGTFSVALAGFAYTDTVSEQAYNCEEIEGLMTCTAGFDGEYTQDFDTLTLSLNGEFSQGDEAFEAALTINAINNGYQVVENESWSHFWREGESSQDQNQDSSSSETANAYVRVNFTLDMNTTLAGISDDVAVRLTGNRNAFRTGTASLRLQYEGKTIDANLALTGAATARAATLTITNNQGATLAVTESNIDDENDALSGAITANNAQQATVAEENDIILIRYNGGYVESF